MSYIFACKPLITNANYPLRLVDYECIDTNGINANNGDYNVKDLVLRDNILFVAKGKKGVDVYALNPSDIPFANSLDMKKLTSYAIEADILGQGHGLLFVASKNKLNVIRATGTKYVNLSLIDFETLQADVSFIEVDKELKYAYIGLVDKGLIIYDIATLKIKYDYTNSFPNIQSLYSAKDSLYLSNNTSIEIYKKTFISDNLNLNKVYENKNASNLKILEVNHDQISFINERNNSIGYYDIISSRENNISLGFKIDGNNSVLAKKNIILNSFYTDSVYKVISSKSGLILIDENNGSFHDMTFNSDKTIIYKNFIISSDNAPTSSAIRIYRFSDTYVSRTSGKEPLEVKFNVRSLNLKYVSWKFENNVLPSYSKSPKHIFNIAGKYNVESKITYNNGESQKETIPIEVGETTDLKLNLLASKKSGNAPLSVRVDLNTSNLLKDIAWSITKIDNVKVFDKNYTAIETNNSNTSKFLSTYTLEANNTVIVKDIRTSPFNWIFNKKGNYTITVNAEDFEENKKEKNVSIVVHSFFEPSIKIEPLDYYTFKDINFTAIIKDEYNKDRNIIHYQWTFHDGAVSNQKNPIFNYKTAGEYNISLELIDVYGMVYKSIKNLKVHDKEAAIISFNKANKDIHESPYETTMSLILDETDKYILHNVWTLPNGSKTRVSAFPYTFNNEGSFKIKNEYNLSNGVNGLAIARVIVNNKVDINISSNINYGFSPLKVDFKISGKAPSGIKDYTINFGDGNISKSDNNQTILSYIYKKAGAYKMDVIANSNKDHSARFVKRIYAINADLSYSIVTKDLDKLSQNYELDVAFNAKLSDNTFVKSTRWFFGDGDMKSQINENKVNHKYKNKQTYNAKFVITLLNDMNLSKTIEVKYPEFTNNINLYSGWNLISNPLSLPLKKSCSSGVQVPDCLPMKKLGTYIDLYSFQENKWIKNPEFIDMKYGFWMKVSNNQGLAFYGSRNTLETENLSVGNWHLLGSGTDINGSKLKSFKKTYIFNAKSQVYIENPSNIPSARGFYGVK